MARASWNRQLLTSDWRDAATRRRPGWRAPVGACGVEGPVAPRIHSAASSVRGSFVPVRPAVPLVRSRPWRRMPRDSTVQWLIYSCAPAGSSLDGTGPTTVGPYSVAGAAGGRVLPRPVEPRQGGPLHPWGELHRLVFVEGVRQGRHHHLGVPADRLSLGESRPSRLRAAWLPQGCRLLLVHVFPDARALSVRPGRPRRHVPGGEGTAG